MFLDSLTYVLERRREEEELGMIVPRSSLLGDVVNEMGWRVEEGVAKWSWEDFAIILLLLQVFSSILKGGD